MRAFSIALAIAATLSSSACAHHSQGNAPGDGSPGAPSTTPGSGSPGDTSPAPPVTATVCRPLEVDVAFDAERACPTWRHLGIARASVGACPQPSRVGEEGWMVEPLFGGSAPPPLHRFCLYEYKGTDATLLPELNADLRQLSSNGQLERLDSTCAAVTRASNTVATPGTVPPNLAGDSQSDFERHFLAQAGEIPEIAKVLPNPHHPSVELAILDTQPRLLEGQGSSNHGFTLGRLAERLICSDPPGYGKTCAARITSELALPILKLDPVAPSQSDVDSDNGGFFGSVDQLARSVWNAIDAEPAPGIQHRVLNLSLAWDGARFGGLERRVRDMPTPVQALYRVLEEAACRDTLVLAAAGNRRGGFDEQDGPLLPAAWETRDAPRLAKCGSHYHGDRARVRSAKREPLLYAVGGIRTDGFPLANARTDGEPRLVAYGDHAVVPQAKKNSPPAILTGSSVATAVVSATAAAAWNLRPELTRSGVMKRLYRSGQTLDRKADFHQGSLRTPPGVRRIAVCPAVADACASGGSCTKSPKCREITTNPPVVSRPSFATLSATFDAKDITRSVGSISLCPERTVLSDPNKTVPESLCPGRQFFGVYARPWTVPQPDHSPCSACQAEPPPNQNPLRNTTMAYKLYIQIDGDWERGALTQPVLEIGPTSLALDLPPLDKNGVAVIEGIDPELFEPVNNIPPAVSLQFLVNELDSDLPTAVVEVPVFIGG